MSKRLLWAAAAVVSLVLVVMAAPAGAHDHRPPPTTLIAGTVTQEGRLGTYCWTAAAGEPGYFGGTCVDATWTFPRAVRVGPSAEIRVRLETSHAPDDLTIRWWPRVENNDFYARPRGTARVPEFVLEPVVVDGETVAYGAVFTGRASAGHMYLDVFGYWIDHEGAGNMQDADWTFHARVP